MSTYVVVEASMDESDNDSYNNSMIVSTFTVHRPSTFLHIHHLYHLTEITHPIVPDKQELAIAAYNAYNACLDCLGHHHQCAPSPPS